MWLNWLSLLIIVGLLVYHLYRWGRIWWSTHFVSINSTLFILLEVSLLIALLTGHRWILGFSVLFLLLIIAWRLHPAGSILTQCEDIPEFGAVYGDGGLHQQGVKPYAHYAAALTVTLAEYFTRPLATHPL